MKKESKHCSDMMKKDFNKEHVMIKEKMKILRTLLNVGFVIIFILMVMLNLETIVISLENIEIMRIEIVI